MAFDEYPPMWGVDQDMTRIWGKVNIFDHELPYDLYIQIETYSTFDGKWTNFGNEFLYTKKEDVIVYKKDVMDKYYEKFGKYASWLNGYKIRYKGTYKETGAYAYGGESGEEFRNTRNFYVNYMRYDKISSDTIYAYIIKPREWNDFTSAINEMLQIKKMPKRNFTKVFYKNAFTADIYNEVVEAIKSMRPNAEIDYAISKVSPITRQSIVNLTKEFNHILPIAEI